MRVISICDLQSVSGGATVNGCTGVPDKPFGFNFKPACDNHDINYSIDSQLSKAQADQVFKNDMLNICKTQYDNSLLCRAAAQIYYAGVTIFGGHFMRVAVSQALDRMAVEVFLVLALVFKEDE